MRSKLKKFMFYENFQKIAKLYFLFKSAIFNKYPKFIILLTYNYVFRTIRIYKLLQILNNIIYILLKCSVILIRILKWFE